MAGMNSESFDESRGSRQAKGGPRPARRCELATETQEPRGATPPRGSCLSVVLRPKACTVEDDLRNYMLSVNFEVQHGLDS